MKPLIAIDQLIEEDNSTKILEHFLNLFPDASIFTLAHKEGAVKGQVEMRPIYSTYLSKIIKNKDDFYNRDFLIPGALNNHKLPKFDCIISISSGYIHGLKIEGVPHYTYIYQWNSATHERSWWSKVFRAYVNNWRQKALAGPDLKSFSSKALEEKLLKTTSEKVIPPLFKAEKFQFNKEFNFHLIENNVLIMYIDKSETRRQLRKFISSAPNHIKHIYVLGDKPEVSDSRVVHSGELSIDSMNKYFENVSLSIDFTGQEFPEYALASLTSGTPVLTSESELKKEILTDEGVHYFKASSFKNIENSLTLIKKVDRASLRRRGLRYNGRIFKSRTLRFMQDRQWPSQS